MQKAQTLKIAQYELPIQFQLEKDGGYAVRCPVWSDCYAQGDSIDEAISEVIAVATSLIELYQEEGMRIPLKSTFTRKATLKVPVYASA